MDKILPFSLRLAPLIFSAIADALLWIVHRRGVSWAIHYLDDFLTMGSPNSDECQSNMEIMQKTCTRVGLPLEPVKTQRLLSTLTSLSIELDTIAMKIRLPLDKLSRVKEALAHWRGHKACRKFYPLSLIGTLAHASKVIRSSRIFLRSLIDLSTTTAQPDHFIRLNVEAKSDIEWWFLFMSRWNGTPVLPLPDTAIRSSHQCFRKLRVWCLLGLGVVPTSMVKYACRHPYISKRIDPNSASHSYMRESLER